MFCLVLLRFPGFLLGFTGYEREAFHLERTNSRSGWPIPIHRPPNGLAARSAEFRPRRIEASSVATSVLFCVCVCVATRVSRSLLIPVSAVASNRLELDSPFYLFIIS